MCSNPIYAPLNSMPKRQKQYLVNVPKQLLPLRSEIPSLFAPVSTSRQFQSPKNSTHSDKFQTLKFIEKENRRATIRSMRAVASHRYSADMTPMMMPVQPTITTTTFGASTSSINVGRVPRSTSRAPSSGISSTSSTSSSSENMLSGLSIGYEEKRLSEEILDPAVEVDLQQFMTDFVPPPPPLSRGQQRRFQVPEQKMRSVQAPPQPATAVATRSTTFQMPEQKMRSVPAPPPSQQPTAYSYSHVKQQPDFVDYSWDPITNKMIGKEYHMGSQNSSGVGSAASSSNGGSAKNVSNVQQIQPMATSLAPPTQVGCNYCWESYVKLCNRVANVDPVFPVDGPWNWHRLFDAQGRTACPRLWFTQIDRAGTEMLEQLTKKTTGYM